MPEQILDRKFRTIIASITSGGLDPLIRYDIVDHNRFPARGDGLPGPKYWARALREAIPDRAGAILILSGAKR
ncbi:hypothetical protein ACFQ36_03180 [Arthrobacter sp. GCM10027362]|uniref:hypothetical protein n=1 Tax=Arthrobacter sp. GCM10027362 TaxID=3273379 RepID=UPI00362CFABC